MTDALLMVSIPLFSPKQQQVLELIITGKPNKIIAYETGLQESTIKVHVRNIMKKLKVTNRTEMLGAYLSLLMGDRLDGYLDELAYYENQERSLSVPVPLEIGKIILRIISESK